MSGTRLGVCVGLAPDAQKPRSRNTKEMREVYVNQTLSRGYRAYLRGDGCEGRRFRHFVERGIERRNLCEIEAMPGTDLPVAVKKLRRLEMRGMRFAALLDLLPSLFYSGWMLLPSRRKARQSSRQKHAAV